MQTTFFGFKCSTIRFNAQYTRLSFVTSIVTRTLHKQHWPGAFCIVHRAILQAREIPGPATFQLLSPPLLAPAMWCSNIAAKIPASLRQCYVLKPEAGNGTVFFFAFSLEVVIGH